MGDIADDTIADLLEGPVRRTRRAADLRGRARRVAERVPEVMVKVSGNARGGVHMKAHLDYISRNGALELEDERGDALLGKDAVRALHKAWSQDRGRRRANTRDTTNLVLSMPAGTEAGAVRKAARDFARRQFADNHQYVFALHTDTDSPHVHLTIKNLGHDGRRLHVKKGDPQRWRERFAAALERQGVEAEATPRATRGVIRKGLGQAIRHMRDRGVVPMVDRAKVEEIVREIKAEQAGAPHLPRPWEARIRERQTHVRKSWLTAARELQRSEVTDDQALAQSIASFVKAMPAMETERHQLRAHIAGQLRTRDAQRETGPSEPERGGDEEER